MDTRVVQVLVALVLLFGSIDGSHFRGGIITFKPSSTTPNAMDFSARLAYRRSRVYCDNTRISSKQLLSTYYESWEMRRYSYSWYRSSSATLYVYCNNFNVGEDWIEGYNNFTLSWGSSYEKYWEFRIYGGAWISAITRAYSSSGVDLSTRYNLTARQNNSSPVSSIPLTVYAIEGIPSVIKIPVHDPDGDTVRCRNAIYNECYQGVCTNWPYGAIHEENCSISYNGGGYTGQLLPVYLKLEDYVNGTTQFEPSQSLGSVGLQFIIHIKNGYGCAHDNSTCLNGGTCRNTSYGYYCSCASGYSGRHCETRFGCHNDTCLNGGTCRNTYYGSGYQCYCPYGHTGRHCETRFGCTRYNHTCLNGGTCYGYYCSCPIGYTGRQCETRLRCASSPCRNGGTCQNTYYGAYRCYCPNGYSGSNCEIRRACASSPCRNGGACWNTYYGGYRCSCASGYTGSECETNLKISITCKDHYMEIDLIKSFFPNVDSRNLHLKNTSCRATTVTWSTITLRTPLDGCGTSYTEDNDTIVFLNQVGDDQRFKSGNHNSITRKHLIVFSFYCKYSRRKLVSTSFIPAKKVIHVSEGNFGNLTFIMDLYKTSQYKTSYYPFDYPVPVDLNENLWIQFEVKNTIADLVVFADSCRATTSVDPNSLPQHRFLDKGCVRDSTMVYLYNSHSSVQRFSIKSFRFVYSNDKLVYLHCELMVCHRNTTNSRCSSGCISSRRRRDDSKYEDSSKQYDMAVGPFKQQSQSSNSKNSKRVSEETIALSGAFGALATVCLVACGVMLFKKLRKLYPKKLNPASVSPSPPVEMEVTANSYGQNGVDLDEKKTEIDI